MSKKRLGILILSLFFVLSLFIRINAQDSQSSDSSLKIDLLDPVQAPIGTEVAISGTGFGSKENAGKVTFYNNKNASIISWSDQLIICEVPSGTKNGKIVVADKEGNKSEGISFKVLSGILLSPANLQSENITTNSVTLKWDSVKNASDYTISMGTSKEATGLESVDVSDVAYNKSNLESNKTYYWKIKSKGSTAKKDSVWSRVVSFKTKAEEVKTTPVETTKQNKISAWQIIIITVLIIIIILAIIIFFRALSRKRRADSTEPELRAEPEEGPLPNINQTEYDSPDSRLGMNDIARPEESSSREPYPPSSPAPSDIPTSSPNSPNNTEPVGGHVEPGLPPKESPTSTNASDNPSNHPNSGVGL